MLMPTLGGPLIFLLPGLFLIAVIPAFIVAVDSFTDRHLTREQRLIGLALSAAVIPAAIVAALVATNLGYFSSPMTVLGGLLTLAAIAAWVLVLLVIRPKAWRITKKSEWKP
jgi:hypothetical protein